MRNRLQLTWRAGVATIALAAAALFVGAPTTMAQMHTEIHGAPSSGAIGAPGGGYQVGGDYGESGLHSVHVDDGGPSLSRDGGGYGVPAGPICVVENSDRGRGGYNQVSDGACGAGGGYPGPIGISGGVETYP